MGRLQIGDEHVAILRSLRAAAFCGAPAPADLDLMEAAGLSSLHTTRRLVRDLEATGIVRMEKRKRNCRRFVFADGMATRWSAFGHGRPGRKRRKCLRCGKEFMSDGPGNRMCDRCRKADSYGAEAYRLVI